MVDMTPEKAAELRKPFPKSAIGKIPKGGMMLDYCGHAAVTDRLIAVDPNWTWEPFAVDESGLPALDRKGNLWIRMTICGVTRIGVGDGPDAKQIVSDALRNAAMRFGVALDLWSKEELEGSHDEPKTDDAVWDAEPDPPARPKTLSADNVQRTPSKPVEGGGGVTDAQLKALGASFRDAGITDRQQRLAFVVEVIDQPVASSKDLSKAQASKVLDALKQRGQQGQQGRQTWSDDTPAEPELQDAWPT